MKKHECNYCSQHPAEACLLCGSLEYDANNPESFYSTLYAAEFLLYAFHFERDDQANGIEQSPKHALMILAAEG